MGGPIHSNPEGVLTKLVCVPFKADYLDVCMCIVLCQVNLAAIALGFQLAQWATSCAELHVIVMLR